MNYTLRTEKRLSKDYRMEDPGMVVSHGVKCGDVERSLIRSTNPSLDQLDNHGNRT